VATPRTQNLRKDRLEDPQVLLLDYKGNRLELLRLGASAAGFYPLLSSDWKEAQTRLSASVGRQGPAIAILHMNDVGADDRLILCRMAKIPLVFYTGGYPPTDFDVEGISNCFMIHRSVETQYGTLTADEWSELKEWISSGRKANTPGFLCPRTSFQALPALRWILLGHHAAHEEDACSALDSVAGERALKDALKSQVRSMSDNGLAPAATRLGVWWSQIFRRPNGELDNLALEQFVADFNAELGGVPPLLRTELEPISVWLQKAEIHRVTLDPPTLSPVESAGIAVRLEALLQK